MSTGGEPFYVQTYQTNKSTYTLAICSEASLLHSIFNCYFRNTTDRQGGVGTCLCSLLIIPQLTDFLVVSFLFTKK